MEREHRVVSRKEKRVTVPASHVLDLGIGLALIGLKRQRQSVRKWLERVRSAAVVSVAAFGAALMPPAAFPRTAGESTSMATATMASTGTMQSAQTHPLNAAGFDKTVLLVKTMLKMTKDDEPESGDKHSEQTPISQDIHTPPQTEAKYEIFCSLFGKYGARS